MLYRFGPRFPAMNRAYDSKLRALARGIAKDLKMEDITREGVYAVLGGPNFETIAELVMLRICGVDAVGKLLSFVPAPWLLIFKLFVWKL